MAFLYQIRADGTQVERWETGARPLVAGRGDCADAFVEDDALSRSHFLIVAEGEEFFLIDLNSSNGTWVNDARVTAHKLVSGEIIMAGESIFCFSKTPVSSVILPAAFLSLQSSDAARVRVRPG
jgi:pSer/pThr/pTyr-binding forkhead associated (FHA) protein